MIKKFLPGKFKTFLRIMLTTQNWIEVFLVGFGLRREVLAVFRNGYQLKVSRKTWPEFMNYVGFFRYFPKGEINGTKAKIKYKSRDLVFNFGRLGPGALTEVFGWKTYKRFLDTFNIKNKLVVDIGAAFGDTAVYFAILGAKKVYAFEPLPIFYKLARENIKINKLETICQVINAAVGKERGKEYLEDPKFEYMFGADTEEYKLHKEVPIITLQDIVGQFKLSNAFLKIDCEGYEYDIILNTPDEILRHFDCILIEYHYGFKSLKDKLEKANFFIKHTKPINFLRPECKEGYQNMRVGYLMGYRNL
jgi:FkbM family methyltransferase